MDTVVAIDQSCQQLFTERERVLVEYGKLRTIPPGGRFRCEMEVGALTPEEAQAMGKKIARILAAG